jgi:hypothetical protein
MHLRVFSAFGVSGNLAELAIMLRSFIHESAQSNKPWENPSREKPIATHASNTGMSEGMRGPAKKEEEKK